MLRLSGLCFLFSAFLLSGEAPTAPPAAGSGTAVFKRIGPFGGDVRSLLLDVRDARVVFAGTSDGQIFRSADGGETWTPIVPGLGRRRLVVDTLVQHPGDPARLFAGAWDLKSDGGELFESSDGGTTWSPVRLPQASVAVRGIAVSSSSPSRMVVGAHGGVYATEDGGKKWVQIGRSGKDFPPVESVAIDPLDPRSIYAGT